MQLREAARNAQAGFTFLELLVSMGFAVVALGAVGSFHRTQLHSLRHQALQNELQMGARDIIDLFTREVRRAGSNPTCAAGITAIADAKPHLLRIRTDADGDGTTTGIGEDVTYEYIFSQNRFDRSADGSASALVDDTVLGGSRIRYFSAAGGEIAAGSGGLTAAQRADVRRVRIELVATSLPGELADGARLRVAAANDVELRNRFFVNSVACP
jgi:type II secretory pathway pseudopilin PulG